MSLTTSEPTRASLDELLVFANKVRQAGGREILDALMPGTPGNDKSCLIARNLNFSCRVTGACTFLRDEAGIHMWSDEDYFNYWQMSFEDLELGEKIATELGLPHVARPNTRGNTPKVLHMLLPLEIGAVARDFDRAQRSLDGLTTDPDIKLTEAERDNIIEMWPYFVAEEKRNYLYIKVVKIDGSLNI